MVPNTRTAAFCFLVTALSAAFCAASEKRSPRPAPDILFPHEWMGNIDRVEFNEPSGLTFHPGRGTVFAVGDNGDLCEIETDGTLVKQRKVRPADFEGITSVPSTGLLYVAIEGADSILEVDPEDFQVRREFAIGRTAEGKLVLDAGGQGIEGIAFVPDESHPEGGTFFVANQSFELGDTEDLSAIFEVELPLRSSRSEAPRGEILRYFTLGVMDLSGLHYDRVNDRLLIISDATNTFFETSRAGEILRSYAFPGDNQEGITLDGDGYIYIAQDSGGIVKARWNREE